MSLSVIGYLIFVHLSLLIPGFAVLRRTGWLKKQLGLELCFGYLLSIALFSSLAFAGYAFKLSPNIVRVCAWFYVLYGSIEFVRLRYSRPLLKLRFPLICLFVMSMLSLSFIGLSLAGPNKFVPDPESKPGNNYSVLSVKVINVAQTQANDNYIPYRQAQFFVNRSDPAKDGFIEEWGVGFFQRTPLMGAVTAAYFTLLNTPTPINYTWSSTGQDSAQSYQKFQIISSVLNSLFIIPAYFLLAVLFKKKTAVVTCIFLVTSTYFLYNSMYSWPKSFVAYFVLLSFLLLLERAVKFTVLAGLVGGLAYLSHDLAVLYIGAGALYLLVNKRYRDILWFTGASTLLALPWVLVSNILYHKPSTFIYYPISTDGIPQIEQKRQVIQRFFDTSPVKLLYIRLFNLFYLFSPYQALTSEGGQDLFRRFWGLSLFSITGSLGFGLIIPAGLAVVKKFRSAILWIFIVSPVVFSVLIIGWPKGLGSLHFAQAVVVLLTGMATSLLLEVKNRRLVVAALAANILQACVFTAYSFNFRVGGWFNLHDLTCLVTILGIYIGALHVLLVLVRGKPNKALALVGI